MVKVQLLTIDFFQINGPMKGHGDEHHASKTQVSHRQIPISIGDHEVRFLPWREKPKKSNNKGEIESTKGEKRFQKTVLLTSAKPERTRLPDLKP
jgi:hypothetical protein